ncbi:MULTISPECIES: hypothetical protein [Frankia]|uniref:Glycosyltransferase RgtA/B/C/D-like domain-containing protein n=1 Tax=Frankia alni (strain DSM 45986 / CECT 9034 / ACN14a) TaxID=326424 RepID=Q0RAN9_FRAAA|nr:hypothetical protein; putative membrane protein [Frankia alni ACN14a]
MPPAGRRRPGRSTVVAAGAVALGLAGVLGLLHAYLTRPLWYDEIWRAHFVSEPLASFWSELTVANTPSALGWLGITRLAGEAFGWHSWSLRLPGFVALPLLGAAIVVLTRRFAGTTSAVFAAGWLCLNTTFLDLATQLKPYTVEALAAVCIVVVWTSDPREPPDEVPAAGAARGPDRGRLVRRTAAGVLALVAVPGIFVVLPLVAVDVWRGPARRWRLVECLPALALSTVHTVGFVAHQSSQRNGDYWDRQFLAGRGPWAALRFVADQVRATVTGSPPGIDRFDPSLVHGTVPAGPFGSAPAVLIAVAVVVAGGTGVVALARHRQGRTLLAALGGAELMMLGASAARYWPFGPTRTNLYVVPLLVVVVVVGAERVIRSLLSAVRGHLPRGGPQRAAGRSKGSPPTLTLPGSVAERSHSVFSPRVVTEGDGTLALSGTLVPTPPASPASPASPVSPASPPPSPPVGATPVPGLAVSRVGLARAAVALPLAAVVAITGCGVLLMQTSVSGSRPLWEHQDRLRGLDLMVDAAIVTRRVARPGDVVAVGGRLARPGWLYAMEASDDGPREPSDLQPGPAGDGRPRRSGAGGTADSAAGERSAGERSAGESPATETSAGEVSADGVSAGGGSAGGARVAIPAPRRAVLVGRSGADGVSVVDGHRPAGRAADARAAGSGGAGTPARIPRRDTVFFGGAAPALLRQLAQRPVPPGHLLVFVFDIERTGLAGQLAPLHRAGWCATEDWTFRLTGVLTRYDRCSAGTPPPRRVIVAYH